MEERILLLGHGKNAGQELAAGLAGLGYKPIASTWSDFAPRSFGRERPALILADVDKKTATPMEALTAEVRKLWGRSFPVIALTESNKFKDLAALLDAGASDCLAKDAPLKLADRKIARCLADIAGETALDERIEEVPLNLLGVFARENSLVPLGDLVSVYPGVANRRPSWRRMAPPDPEWRGVITSDVVDRFYVGKPDAYLWWNRLALFRLPHPAEYSVAEKVLLRRTGPPLAAAVDRSRLPAGADVYSLVPVAGVSAGYVACLLNSRLLDFYFNRLAGTSGDGRLRPEDVRSAPVPRPDPAAMRELERISVLLAHFGPNPQSWIDRKSRDELREHMEETVFSLYGADSGVREGLAAMHF